MVLSFKKQFAEPILKGDKIHSIREDRPGRWKAGNKIHMATGVRTKYYNQFNEGREDLQICKSVQEIEICRNKYVEVDGKALSDNEVQELAIKDGFPYEEEFFDFFFKNNKSSVFRGKLIHWTDKKY